MKTIHFPKSQSSNLSEKLQTLLANRGVSEAEIAHSIGLPVMTVRRIIYGETVDPRISTLQLLADYFDISIDSLIGSCKTVMSGINKVARLVPILDWKDLQTATFLKQTFLNTCQNYHPITLSDHLSLSDHAFGIESRPSMQPRFPRGTLFVIDPNINPIDGDLILVRMRPSMEVTIRELIVDAPAWQLLPVVAGSEVLYYSKDIHDILGVVMLTMLYARKQI